MNKNIHYFSQDTCIKNDVDAQKLGFRGRQANQLAELSLPILPGFIINADGVAALEGCNVGKETASFLRKIEGVTGKVLDNPENPLLLKVVISPNLLITTYPTLHNFGLTRNTITGFTAHVGENFATHELMFLIRGMLKVEMHIAELEGRKADVATLGAKGKALSDEMSVEKIKKTAVAVMDEYAAFLPRGFFDSAAAQLDVTLKRLAYMLGKEEGEADTALLVQPMVYGNYGKDSASGNFFTRNIVTGDKQLQGEYFQEKFDEIGATGNDINKIAPAHLKELEKIAAKLEDYQKEIRMIRFTIEDKKLWLIEQRPVDMKSTQADIKLLLDLNRRKIVDNAFVVKSVKPGQLNEILHPVIDTSSVKKLPGKSGGIAGAPGAAIGRVFFSTESLLDAYKVAQQKGEDKRMLLVMPATFAEDVKAIEVATGVLSCEGGYSAHASVVARQYGKVSLVKPDMKIRGKKATIGDISFQEGDYVTLNVPYYGEPWVYVGKASLIEPDPKESGLFEFIDITKTFVKDFTVRTNADQPKDAALALSFGADGIGLVRTEHMFFNEKRINVFRRMILADSKEERASALDKIGVMQTEDFYGLFKVMQGKEVCIRLLDAPLHEFLPHNETEMKTFMDYLDSVSKTKVSRTEVGAKCDALSEFNPMLGHRGCRIAISYPEIYEMQVKAIFNAAYRLQEEKVEVHPEVMIPIVMSATELKQIVYGKKIEGGSYKGVMEVEEEFRAAKKAKKVPFKVGTMIELPIAALAAGEIAKYAEFFSFGTNDLTQTTIGLSRDDFNAFMPDYTKYDILENNPFSHLNQYVKELIGIAVRRGTTTRPNLVKGLCGEHGAIPENIRFCMDAGLNYVSCSPYSVPIALLAIAQIELERAEKEA